ncbi:hypothetical protein EW093_07875 [Thiospirochaeta perfilievii]|uniref:Uncharacterized protein n=1 Tax=Thiospirochaeta perfilievii TaxID=252967 RepID=A0A5C1Q942_9SPIO|nr:hypothetical protein [Thiospirochaeta perfilievii]QEN04623.1 hypothetical protein EW093_07875 [Thiospirochaeta perfilievii]
MSCSQEKEIEEVIFEGQYEDTSKLKYILSEDMNDNIIGYGIFNAESNDEFFDIKELERRDFKPDKVIYYSNDTKTLTMFFTTREKY